MNRKAVLDIGTNSIKFCLAELNEHNECVFVVDTSAPTRLGEGMHKSRQISSEALERNARAAADFAAKARELGADEILVTGTAAARKAKNTEDFDRRLYELSGLHLRVLSGEEEARLSNEAVLSELGDRVYGRLMTMDIGGGSTEFIFTENKKILRRFSVPLGAVVLTEQWKLQNEVSRERLQQARDFVKTEFSSAGVVGPVERALGVGGTVNALARSVKGNILTAETLESMLHVFAGQTAEQRQKDADLPPGRADIIVGGIVIIIEAMQLAGVSGLTASTFGLRHALLKEMFSRQV